MPELPKPSNSLNESLPIRDALQSMMPAEPMTAPLHMQPLFRLPALGARPIQAKIKPTRSVRPSLRGRQQKILRIDPANQPQRATEKRPVQQVPRPVATESTRGNGGISTAADGFLIDHAKDLIGRLAEWSLRLDTREQSLDDRERELNRRLRVLRQLQWPVDSARSSKRSNSRTG